MAMYPETDVIQFCSTVQFRVRFKKQIYFESGQIYAES